MPSITSQNVALAITKLVASQAVPSLVGNLFMARLVNRDYERAFVNAGDVISIPIPPAYVANNIAETGSVQTQAPSLGNAQIAINTHAEVTFVIPDVVKALANPVILATYMEPALIALAERIEKDLLKLHPLLTFNAAVGTANTTITESVVDKAETTLFNAKVPDSVLRILITNGDTYGDIRQIARFSELDKIGDGLPIASGQVGRLKNFIVGRSQYVDKVGSTTNGVAFARDAFALVMRQLPRPLTGTGAIAEFAEYGGYGMRVVMSYAPSTLAQQFTVDVLYGCGILRPEYGVKVLS